MENEDDNRRSWSWAYAKDASGTGRLLVTPRTVSLKVSTRDVRTHLPIHIHMYKDYLLAPYLTGAIDWLARQFRWLNNDEHRSQRRSGGKWQLAANVRHLWVVHRHVGCET